MTFVPYDQIAGEYYNGFHKTCRNFDQTTLKAMDTVRARIPANGLILDIGCGRGRCVEFLSVKPRRVVQLDNSSKMLNLAPREDCLLRLQHNAEQLPFLDAEFSCVTAFLCDPFLGLNFLGEVHRVLAPKGLLIATTPSYEWGTALRRGISIGCAETRFKTLAGTEVRVPSVLVSREQLLQMLCRVGFTTPRISIQSLRLPNDAIPISDDIALAATELRCPIHDLDILYLVVAEK